MFRLGDMLQYRRNREAAAQQASKRRGKDKAETAGDKAWDIAWRRFGRHSKYGNDHPRPLLRGWLHTFVLVAGELAFLVYETPFSSPRVSAMARWTLIGYYGSFLFHVVPWANMRSYQRALATDFMTICLGFTGQAGVLTDWGVFAQICILLTAMMAILCVSGLFLQSEQPLWEYHRDTRKAIMVTMIAVSCITEAMYLPLKWAAALIIGLKYLAFYWFATYGRYDAPRRSALTIPGIWTDHDNFHVLSTALHALQLYAVSKMD